MVRLLSNQVSSVLAVDGIIGSMKEFAGAVGLKQPLSTQILAKLVNHVRSFQRHAASRVLDCLLLLHFATVPILLLLLRTAKAFCDSPEPADPLYDLADDFVHLGLSKMRSQFFGLFLCSPRTARANHHLTILEAELAADDSLVAHHSVRSFGIGLALRWLSVQVGAL